VISNPSSRNILLGLRAALRGAFSSERGAASLDVRRTSLRLAGRDDLSARPDFRDRLALRGSIRSMTYALPRSGGETVTFLAFALLPDQRPHAVADLVRIAIGTEHLTRQPREATLRTGTLVTPRSRDAAV
jgi:hypothetical protein